MARVLTSTHFHQVVGRHGVRSAKARKWTPTLTNRLLWLLTKLPLCPTLGHLAGGTGGRRARRLPCRPARHRSPPGPATPGVPWRARTQRPHGGRLHPHPPLRGSMFLCPLSRALTRANQGPYTPFIHPRPTLTQVCQLRCGRPPHQSGYTVRLLQCCGTGFNYSPPRSRNLGGREHAWA